MARISLGTLAAIAMTAVMLPESATAEETNRASDLLEPQIQLQKNPFESTAGDGQQLDVFDLIHRAQFGTSRSMQEFNLQQREILNDAAADFRSRQLQMLEKNQQPEISEEEPLPNSDSLPGDTP
ncbi:hypothetical protein [Laspinema olomoucense]|uniref:Uncharacterized protein n=1 Tax=Laspinema olomoucense D3b TaxID=2953688 RepID=A0ABT2N648_9CYAN|nr:MULTISPECIES: hypothetical protein [unclassified Laspinema]MCT7972669.1 hypothetical protein [Laspinema sp. D3d]MCT7978174.1 hypothetical protein [Laspinema sp. D3b]MCT7988248.1 hypothetical protein [Laspinema sp. D3a]MCT7995860.1 hypothetical protein [Laspinema sp. D3c]